MVEAAKRAKREVAHEMADMGKMVGSPYRAVPEAATAAYNKVARAAEAADQKIVASGERTAKARASAEERAQQYVSRVRDRYFAENQRKEEQASRRSQQYAEKQASRTGYWSMRYMDRMMRGAGRLGLDIARGAGVDLSLGSNIGRAVQAQTQATNIVNQATLAGQEQAPGAAGRLVDRARGVADSALVGTNDALGVLGAFQAKSSDLKTGEATLERLAKLAKASGTEFSDMGEAAGAVNAQLEDSPDRAERLLAIMRHITKQTADGSVEMSDYSRYVGRIAAAANQYGGSFEENIGSLGALSQMAMKGGASTATEATRSAAAFSRDITKDKALKKFEGAGIDVFTDKTKRFIRDPEAIITDYIKKKGTNRADLAQFFTNDVSKRAVQNSLALYDKAGGGEKGLAAVHADFAKFKATISDRQVNTMSDAVAETDAAKIQKFNNQLDRIGANVASSVLPAMEKLTPTIEAAVGGLGKLVAWAADNPGQAIAAALTASIARAGVETVVRSGIENILKSAAGGTTGYNSGAGFGGGIGVAGNLAAAFVIASAAVTIANVGMMMIDNVADKQKAGEEKTNELGANTMNVLSKEGGGRLTGDPIIDNLPGRGMRSEDPIVANIAADKLAAERAALVKRIEASQGAKGFLESVFSTNHTVEGEATKRADAANNPELMAQLALLNAKLSEFGRGTLTVHIASSAVNVPGVGDPAGPGVMGGRTGPTAMQPKD